MPRCAAIYTIRNQDSGSDLERRDVACRDDGEGIRHQERALPRWRDDALQKLLRRLPLDRVAVMSVRCVLQLSFLARTEAGRDRSAALFFPNDGVQPGGALQPGSLFAATVAAAAASASAFSARMFCIMA